MNAPPEPGPLDLRALFARPWTGPAVLWLPWWLRWLRLPRRFEFRTEILVRDGANWVVRDEIMFPNGRSQIRLMYCQPLADGRLLIGAEDMPAGTLVTPRSDGFDFLPYTIRTPVLGSLRLPLRFRDTVALQANHTLVDEIEMRFLGLRVGRITIRLVMCGPFAPPSPPPPPPAASAP